MPCAMEPAELVRIVITIKTDNGFPIKIVFTKDEENPNKDNTEVQLVMNLEQQIIMVNLIPPQQISHFLGNFLKAIHLRSLYPKKWKEHVLRWDWSTTEQFYGL